MTPGTANYPDHRRGDTIPARTVTVTQDSSPLDLSGIDIQSDFVLGGERVRLRIGSGITVVDALGGVFRIDEMTLKVVGTWAYDLQLVYPDGAVRTLLAGKITVIEDITR